MYFGASVTCRLALTCIHWDPSQSISNLSRGWSVIQFSVIKVAAYYLLIDLRVIIWMYDIGDKCANMSDLVMCKLLVLEPHRAMGS